jgi:predicted transcriptional regulator
MTDRRNNLPVRLTFPLQMANDWTFLTNHAHVLICLSRNPESLLREVAAQVGITEGAVQRIVADLVDAGYLRRSKVGRRNSYELHTELPLRHPLERDHAIGEILDIVGPTAAEGK